MTNKHPRAPLLLYALAAWAVLVLPFLALKECLG